MAVIGGWEQLGDPIGKGGQSDVYLVRNPARVAERSVALEGLRHAPWGPFSDTEMTGRLNVLLTSLHKYLRPEDAADLGALKMFKIPDDPQESEEAVGRLRNEIAVLQQNRPGLIKLLDASEEERWIVTEFMGGGTIEKHPDRFKGDPLGALKAVRSLAEAAASLHKDNYVHRDIKPANVFIKGDRLILGDLGIVYVPDPTERLTVTNERVGPRDYMPQWADLGERLEKVHTNFDVYMLGKLLWCMVTGRLKLPREWHKRPAYDVTVLFPNDPAMHIVKSILDKCIVEEPQQCLSSAKELLDLIDENLPIIELGGQLLEDGIRRPCHVCGRGEYQRVQLDANVVGRPLVNLSMAGKPIEVAVFACDWCHHVELFRVTSDSFPVTMRPYGSG
jgi:serine/threonine protein kinase